MNNVFFFLFVPSIFSRTYSATRIYTNPRGTGFARGGKPHAPHVHQPHHDRPLPPSYVCYRCGQKGWLFVLCSIPRLIPSEGHWIQDCPTNNDREFDNRPRIKRTTGIPRSMLKAVENPNSAELAQGVMVTPEGGYVVAQPDLYVTFPSYFSTSNQKHIRLVHRGKNRYRDRRD
jgi:protein MPE1